MLYKNLNPDGTLIIESYMYSPSLGRDFLPLYFNFRNGVISKLLGLRNDKSKQSDQQFLNVIRFLDSYLSLMSSRNFLRKVLDGDSPYLESIFDDSMNPSTLWEKDINLTESSDLVSTEDLICKLIYLKTNHVKNNREYFTDLLIQKFEASKKLSDHYCITNNQSNITISRGSNKSASLRTYWMFSLLLLTSSVGVEGIRILSTLLKVNDLLCTIPSHQIAEAIDPQKLAFTLAVETLIVDDIQKKILAKYETN
jgi:hypothetical protein